MILALELAGTFLAGALSFAVAAGLYARRQLRRMLRTRRSPLASSR